MDVEFNLGKHRALRAEPPRAEVLVVLAASAIVRVGSGLLVGPYIVFNGGIGAGKTTTAERLAGKLNVPLS